MSQIVHCFLRFCFTVSTVTVEAVLGKTATLPCDIEPEELNDRVYMVLWFRESAGKPLYSYDVRGRQFSKALYWSETSAFGPRAYFVTISKPAALSVDNIQLDDEGVYRCRVDFQNSPTRNHRINLTVTVPPHQILVYDASGLDVTGAIGPLQEDDNLVLTCEVRGGRPEPTVTWLNGNEIMQTGGGVSMGRHVTVNRLEIPKMTRSALNNTYKCQASNTKLVPPAERSIRVDMLLKPLSTALSSKPKQLIADQEYVLACNVEGSVPETDIKWMQNNRPYMKGKIKTINNSSMVSSVLSFRPHPDDDGTILKCEGSNPRLQNSALEDSVIMNVLCNIMIVGASLDETVPVPCHVAADPLDVSFDWNFSNSGERFEVASGQFNLLQEFHSTEGITQSRYDADEDNSETIYELLYTPKSEREYGTLACWAKNSIGKQKEPCLFQVVPAAEPSPLRNCTLRPYSTLLPPGNHGPHGTQNTTSAASAGSAYSYYAGEPSGTRAGQHYRDTNYVGPQFVKDRNVPSANGTTTSTSTSTGRRNVTKFNQKNPSSALGRRTSNRTAGGGGGFSPGRDSDLARLTADEELGTVEGHASGSKQIPPLVPEQQRRRASGKITPGSRSSASSSSSNSEERNSRMNLLNTATAVLLGEGGSAAVLASSATGDDPAGQQRGNRLRRYAASDGARNDSLPGSVRPDVGSNQRDRPMEEGQRPRRGGNNYRTTAASTAPPPIASQLKSKAIRYQSGPSPYSSGSYSTGWAHHDGAGVRRRVRRWSAAALFLEAYDSRTRKLRLNITSALNDVPLFRIDLTDDTDGFAILPIAALLTGALFTIGIAVLLVVVLAIRRKRDGHGTGLCDGKEKHIGMDITVTTPLEMGMGQQKYVVAYTLKQGVEKQPDILSAQKTGSASVQSIKDMGGGKPGGAIYATQGYDPPQQKSTPSSRQSTLKRTADTANSYSLLQQQQQQPTGTASKYSTELLEYEKPYPNYQPTLQYNHNPPPLVDPYAYKSSPLGDTGTTGYRLTGGMGGGGEYQQSQGVELSSGNPLDYRNASHSSSSSNLKQSCLNSASSSGTPSTGTATSGTVGRMGGTTGNPEYRYSGSEFVTDLLDFGSAPSPSSGSSNVGATLTKNRNRQHIITDTLPGPESCV
ncbi:hypothetical protein ZHAS_00009768 [Anopheles sinensis]|uniref:Ig-like domain-containing protein n=1 Tax=Anopheles sinensis TaxID=74873 RepID=A0A084VVW3_ANOSI|nr:hypothetical protein ZHAS_00009768 [Anopheles sinensis]